MSDPKPIGGTGSDNWRIRQNGHASKGDAVKTTLGSSGSQVLAMLIGGLAQLGG